jgi:glycerophosphoryl diester phosphodiesterase
LEIVAHRRSPRPAHRAAVIAALRAALASGADRIEFDVLPLPSGLVVAHHLRVARGAQPLPLEDALDLLAADETRRLLADLKHADAARGLGAALAARGLGARTIVCGELRPVIEAARLGGAEAAWTLPAAPEARPGPWGSATARGRARVRRAAAAAIDAGRCATVCVEQRFVDRALVEAVHAAGGRVYAWTVDSERELRRLAALGVDGLITHDPQLARRVRAATEVTPRAGWGPA